MLQDSTNSWKAFSASCWLWKHFSLQIVVEMIEVVVGWWEVRWIWQMRQNFIVQFVQLLKHWLCNHVVRRCHAKNWAHSVDLCWLQMLLFSVHLTDVLSILCQDSESCSRSDGQQTTKQWPWQFFGARLALGSGLELLVSLTTELVATSCYIKSTFRHILQSNWEIVCCCVE